MSSSGGCSDRNNQTCTSFDGAIENTVAGLVTLKTASGCTINVTGGTEVRVHSIKLLNNWPHSQDYDLVSHTTYVVCVHFIHEWRDLQFKVDSER